MGHDSDVVARLGYLTLGTRLKRLAEQLQAGVGDALLDEAVTIQPGQLPLLVALRESEGLSIAELVQAIGISQPAISRTIGALQRSGHVTMKSDAVDARIRRVALTTKSLALLERLQRELFIKVAAAAEELCAGVGLLADLSIIEKRNREVPFAKRIRSQH